MIPIQSQRPFQKVVIDVLSLPTSEADQEASTIVQVFLDKLVLQHGVPEEVLSDRGSNFRVPPPNLWHRGEIQSYSVQNAWQVRSFLCMVAKHAYHQTTSSFPNRIYNSKMLSRIFSKFRRLSTQLSEILRIRPNKFKANDIVWLKKRIHSRKEHRQARSNQ